MTIIDLMRQDGFSLRRKASTNGGEYAGPCPWCGGSDRFVAWPRKGDRGAYWCRQCGRTGDSIQYLRDCRCMSFQEACALLAIDRRTSRRKTAPHPAGWQPADAALPSDLWRLRAESVVDQAMKLLWTHRGIETLRWLALRGLVTTTVQRFRLGLIGSARYETRSVWGLPDNGRSVWLPSGLLIPVCRNGAIVRLRVRRRRIGSGPRYVVVSGSSMRPFAVGSPPVCMIVESELDAMLVHQAAGDLATAIALGSAQVRPDSETHALLAKSPKVLVALDADDAGAKQAWSFYLARYRNAVRWPPIRGKDPGEMAAHGCGFIRSWVLEGLK